MNRRNWIVSISTDEDDPHVFGPYVKHTAEELAAKFNERIRSEDYGFIHAGAYPIGNPGIRGMLAEFGQ